MELKTLALVPEFVNIAQANLHKSEFLTDESIICVKQQS